MSVKKNIEFHIGETWVILFTLHNADGSAMDLTGAAVKFRIGSNPGLLTKTIGAGITITNLVGGAGTVTITPADQVAAALVKGKTYPYELRAELGAFISVQAIGDLTTLPSLFV